MRYIYYLLISLMIIACSETKMVDEKQKILDTDTEFARDALKIGTAEAFKKYADENALMLSDGEQPIKGREAIFKKMSENNVGELIWNPEDADVSKDGTLGYSWGRWEFKLYDSGIISYGKYVSIWKKSPGGSWKWVVDVGNANPNPEE